MYNKDKFKSAADIIVSRLERMVSHTEAQIKEMRHSLELYKKDPGRNQPQLDNFAAAVDSLSSMARVTLRTLGKTAFKSVSDPWKVFANEAKESRYEEGKPADPTENMSPEDAAEWERNTEEHKDKFKSAAAELPAKFDPDYQQQLALMTKNPPKVSDQDQGIVIEVFSPFVKKYVPMAEYPSAELAEKDLGVWQKAHRETLQNLRASIKSEKSASISSAAAWKVRAKTSWTPKGETKWVTRVQHAGSNKPVEWEIQSDKTQTKFSVYAYGVEMGVDYKATKDFPSLKAAQKFAEPFLAANGLDDLEESFKKV